MADKKSRPSAGSPDSLTKTSTIELSESDLAKVSGGKAKTADKAYQQMDAYIKQ